MKKLVRICIVLLIGVVVFGGTKTDNPNEPKTDLEKMNIKGKVKKLKNFYYAFYDSIFGFIIFLMNSLVE